MTIDPARLYFETELKHLEHQVIWRYSQSWFNGSVFSLDIGAVVEFSLSPAALASKHASTMNRIEGEYSLFVEGEWQLYRMDELVCSSTDSSLLNGPIDRGLASLMNKKIQTVSLGREDLDLTVTTQDNLSLHMSSVDSLVEDCYLYSTPETSFSVGLQSILAIESRNS